MSRLIDADELNKTLGIDSDSCSTCSWGYRGRCSRGCDFEDACCAIEDAPTIDAVPVVRCRDCKHYKFTNDYAFGFPEKGCELTGFNDVDEDDFCSRGWRKDGKQ